MCVRATAELLWMKKPYGEGEASQSAPDALASIGATVKRGRGHVRARRRGRRVRNARMAGLVQHQAAARADWQ